MMRQTFVRGNLNTTVHPFALRQVLVVQILFFRAALLWNVSTRFLPIVKSEMKKGIQSLCYTSVSLKKKVCLLLAYYNIAF